MRIAAHYEIDHRVRQVSRQEFRADLPRILAAMDQPTVDGVNTWYASKAVAECGLRVVVSGVGGDELFQGYSTFRDLPRLVRVWSASSRLPLVTAIARRVFAIQSRITGNMRWAQLPDWARTISGAWWLRRGLFSPTELPSLMGEELAAAVLCDFDPDSWVARMSGCLPSDAHLALAQIESSAYLRNQLLRDSDWASMDHGVELRTPLVDAWLLRDLGPILGFISEFPNKVLLSSAPSNRLPSDVLGRRKSGFGVPLSSWMSDGESSFRLDSRSWSRQLVSSYEE
jgi:asparagine synthase (glutamine-hydrolysing)